MHNVFNLFVDGRASVKRCMVQLMVGGTAFGATLVVLARVVSSLTVGAP